MVALTSKTSRFVEEYALDHNGTAAAVRAGYSPRSAPVTASRLLRNANVRGALAERQGELAEKLALDRQQVVGGLLKAAELAEEQRNPLAMVAALREIGKMLGYYEPERKTIAIEAVGDDVKANFSVMSNAQLTTLIAAGSAA